MIKTKTFLRVILSMVLMTGFFTASCISSTTAKGPDCVPDQSLLEKRVAEVWQYKKADQWIRVYDFTTEKYRESHAKESFVQPSNARIKSFSIKTIDVHPEDPFTADVTVDFVVSHMTFDFPFHSEETWVFENCNWFLVIPEDTPETLPKTE